MKYILYFFLSGPVNMVSFNFALDKSANFWDRYVKLSGRVFINYFIKPKSYVRGGYGTGSVAFDLVMVVAPGFSSFPICHFFRCVVNKIKQLNAINYESKHYNCFTISWHHLVNELNSGDELSQMNSFTWWCHSVVKQL